MFLSNHMRSNQQSPILMLIEETDKDFLIWRPGATSYEYLIVRMRCFLRRRSRIRTSHPTSESFADRQVLCRLLNLEHTVETGISYHIHILDADAFEQSFAFLILHEETGKTLQYICITPAIPLEEHLILAEDTAHTIGRNVAMLQDMKEIRPELILDEKAITGRTRRRKRMAFRRVSTGI